MTPNCRQIKFIDGDKDESAVPFAELWDRSLALLGALHARGIKAGDQILKVHDPFGQRP